MNNVGPVVKGGQHWSRQSAPVVRPTYTSRIDTTQTNQIYVEKLNRSDKISNYLLSKLNDRECLYESSITYMWYFINIIDEVLPKWTNPHQYQSNMEVYEIPVYGKLSL